MNRLVAIVLGAALGVSGANAQQRDLSQVEVKTETVRPGVHVLFGAGGNIGVSSGPDGVFLIDDQFAPLTPKIQQAVAKISDQPVRFVLNTHWHGDHTGGNENFGKAGALIVAHDNVRVRMSSDQFLAAFNEKVPASPAGALPVVTFSETTTFHINGDALHVVHVPNAHTDGDSIVHFTRANVLHMGDTFFNNSYPFIDISSGGSIQGVIAAADRALALTNAETRVIPGHGSITDRQGLVAYRDMLRDITAKVQAGIDKRQTLAQIQAAKPTASHDARWGNGFIKPDQFVAFVHAGLTAPKAKSHQHGGGAPHTH